MNSAYLFVYRLYITLKRSTLGRSLHRWPRARRSLDTVTKFVSRRLFPSRKIWVQVQSGVGQGLWLHLRIPEEAGFWRGEHEPEIQRQIATVASPGDIVYDVGAHLGSLALVAARIVAAKGSNAGGRVVAFDADPANVLRLQEHAVRNNLQQALQAVHAGVWSSATTPEIAFRRGKSSLSQGGVEADGQRPVLPGGELIHVPVITLDQFAAASDRAPQLIKVDVEGGECEVLRGGSLLLARQRPLLIVEVHHQQACETLSAWLDEFGYSCKWKIPPEKFPRYLLAWPAERSQSFAD